MWAAAAAGAGAAVTDMRYALYELGSNSLKLYLVSVDTGEVETHKLPWGVAHELFSTGVVSEARAGEVVSRLQEARSLARAHHVAGSACIATGVFRELPGLDGLTARVQDETGIRIRVISGTDEARLMGRGVRELGLSPPFLLLDLGGASMEWVLQRPGEEVQTGSLPLGAIRVHHRSIVGVEDPAGQLERAGAYCDAKLASLPPAPTLHATGGTAKALAALAGRDTLELGTVRELAAEVARHGPPQRFKPARRRVLLAGLVVLWRSMAHTGATRLHYLRGGVKDGMVRRLVRLLQQVPVDALHPTMLLESTEP